MAPFPRTLRTPLRARRQNRRNVAIGGRRRGIALRRHTSSQRTGLWGSPSMQGTSKRPRPDGMINGFLCAAMHCKGPVRPTGAGTARRHWHAALRPSRIARRAGSASGRSTAASARRQAKGFAGPARPGPCRRAAVRNAVDGPRRGWPARPLPLVAPSLPSTHRRGPPGMPPSLSPARAAGACPPLAGRPQQGVIRAILWALWHGMHTGAQLSVKTLPFRPKIHHGMHSHAPQEF